MVVIIEITSLSSHLKTSESNGGGDVVDRIQPAKGISVSGTKSQHPNFGKRIPGRPSGANGMYEPAQQSFEVQERDAIWVLVERSAAGCGAGDAEGSSE